MGYAIDEEVSERIKRIEERLEALERIVQILQSSISTSQTSVNMKDLLALPVSLQKTMLTIQELGEATSSEVSDRTGRDRSVETIYLNQLERLGFLSKERRGHRYYFKVLRYY